MTASEPVLVGHSLTSTDGQTGDPALAFAVPVEQYRTNYSFLTPQEYDEDYVSVVAGVGEVEPRRDGHFHQLSPIDDEFVGGAIPLNAGQHTLNAPVSAACWSMVIRRQSRTYSQVVSILS